MSETIAKNQIFEYDGTNPFHIINIIGAIPDDDAGLLNHWHTELEITYVFQGSSTHYIDRNCIHSSSDKIIVVNSESVHNIIPDPNSINYNGVIAVVVIISSAYLRELLPDYDNTYFVSPDCSSREELWNLMKKISDYGLEHENKLSGIQKEEEIADLLHIKGLIHLLLSYLYRNGARPKDTFMHINDQKNVERLRGVLSYIQNHYAEPISQADIAKKFYFSREYFSRFFKKSTGLNFVDYIIYYRVTKAKMDIIYTDKTILTIALDHGFSDSRSLINAFKKQYDLTPLQYRKQYKQNS